MIKNWLFRRLFSVTPGFRRIWSPTMSKAGINITHDNALCVSTLWACVHLIADTISALPFHVMREGANGDKTREADHPVDYIISKKPNKETTAFVFWQTMLAHRLTWGNAYAEIERNEAGTVTALWVIPPDRVEVKRMGDSGEIVYSIDADTHLLPKDKVLHLRGLSFDGLVGYSPIAYHRTALGLAKATEEFGSSFFSNGATPNLVIKTVKKLDTETIEKIRSSWKQQHGSTGNWLKPAFLESDMQIEKLGIPPEDAQFIETQKFSAEQIARIYRCPPHKVGLLDKATFNNIEHLNIEFTTDTLKSHITNIEQEVDVKLMPRSLKSRGLFSRINIFALLKGDMKSQQEAFNVGVRGGWLSPNDVRNMMDMNRIPGKTGDVYMVQAQMVPLDKINEEPKAPLLAPGAAAPMASDADDTGDKDVKKPDEGEDDERFAPIKILSDAVKRVHRKEKTHFMRKGNVDALVENTTYLSWTTDNLSDACECFKSCRDGTPLEAAGRESIRALVRGWVHGRTDVIKKPGYNWDTSVGYEIDELVELLS